MGRKINQSSEPVAAILRETVLSWGFCKGSAWAIMPIILYCPGAALQTKTDLANK